MRRVVPRSALGRVRFWRRLRGLGAAPDLYLLHAVDPKVPLATSVRGISSGNLQV